MNNTVLGQNYLTNIFKYYWRNQSDLCINYVPNELYKQGNQFAQFVNSVKLS